MSEAVAMRCRSIDRIDAGRRSRDLSRCCFPLALLGGALGSQYFGGLHPCEMCWWQRYPHVAAIVLAVLAFTGPAFAPARGR